MDTQHYQPLSAALVSQPNLLPPDRSPQQHYTAASYHAYAHPQPAANGTYQHPSTAHREEEEEEAEDDEDDDNNPDDDPDHHDKDHPTPSAHSSPRTAAGNAAKASGAATVHYVAQPAVAVTPDASQNADDSKRKPGRPRGSRNRKPRAPPSTSTKAPSNSQHPGFYQYPPPPAGTTAPNQAFYEFQWRALNLCSEFYNAAEELIKAASPIVISQCYQLGPGTKIDPMALIAEAKRVCDNLLANPAQLVGQPPPAPPYPGMPAYGTMPPPPAPGPVPQATNAGASGSVISNPQSFVMPLSAPPAPYPPQTYYAPPGYPAPAPGSRYPTAPYYSYAPAPAPYYPAAPQAQPTPAPSTPAPPTHSGAATPAPAPAASTSAQASAPAPAPSAPAQVPPSSLSAFNASTGTTAPGGTQGAWSTEETSKLKQLAEQSRETSGAQGKGEIEWDWVVQHWGNTRTRHQILLKATALGLKESTTRGTKRRRGDEASAHDEPQRSAPAPPTAPPSTPSAPVTAVAPSTTYVAQPPVTAGVSPGHSSATATSNPPSANASPATQPQRPPSSATMPAPTTARTAAGAGLAWPMPTIAANTPSPVMANAAIDPTRTNYYRPRPGAAPGPSYGTSAIANTVATSPSSARPPSSHGRTQHGYMFSPQQSNASAPGGRRENGIELVAPPAQSGPALPQHPPGLNVPPVNQSPPAAQVRTRQRSPPASRTHEPHPLQYQPYSQPYPVVAPTYAAPYSAPLPPAYYQQPPPPQQRNDPAQTQPHDQAGQLHEHAPLMHEQFPSSELRYTQQIEQQQQHHPEHPDPATEDSPPATQAPAAGPSQAKRKDKPAGAAGAASGEDEGPPPAKRRRAATRSAIDNGDEDDVGPGGGAKHWTTEEKARLFRWILEDDERWEQFGSKMNVIFREGSEKLFASRKSFTALKSCYHRNLDVFKQIWLFDAFLARPPPAAPEPAPGTPSSSTSAREVNDILHAAVPASFDTPQERTGFLEKKLEAARLLEVPIANLNVKVIDNWLSRGWYTMFKHRFKEDPKTGLPIASHDGAASTWSVIPPPLTKLPPEEDSMEHDEGDKELPHSPAQLHSHPPQRPADASYTLLTFPSTPKPAMSRVSTQPNGTPRSQHAALASPSVRTAAINGNGSTNGHFYAPSTSRQRSQSQSHAQAQAKAQVAYPHSAHSSPQLHYAPPPPGAAAAHPAAPNGAFYPSPPSEYAAPPGQPAHAQAQFQHQTLAALAQLAGVADSLAMTSRTMLELVNVQVQDGKEILAMLKRKEERELQQGGGAGRGEEEALGRTQKAGLAMELLSKPGVDGEVKAAAADYLKKIFQ
ncbi:hypothetical protein EIP86_007169 [Pleurotus ostreatoroseus]|nr:hypothetical protein EIP86_007169 [Pleurotus ostreatoroseus]